jgi:hypothetical protein
MIQFNLLPAVKVEFIKAKRAKRLVILSSGIAVFAGLGLLIIALSITSLQNKHISDLNKDIKSLESGLQAKGDLARILTIQNQLNSLPDLYAKRPVVSRLFGYVQATTPAQVSIGKLSMDLAENTLKIQGTADTLESVNRYADTLKFTTYSVKDDTAKVNAFTNVVLTSFGRDIKAASYTIAVSYSPSIFDSSKEVTLNVPKTITTRSETELPNSGVFDSKAIPK